MPDNDTARSGESPPRFEGAAFDVVATVSSAGGLQALMTLVAGLPADFPAAILVVQHVDPRHRSLLADILAKRTSLRVKQADEGEALKARTIYIARPDHHLLVTSDGTISLTRSELVNFSRPSADLLLESVAASYKDRAIAVVLTGTGRDGASGAQAFKKMGGTVIAQDEGTSQFFGMPSAAIGAGATDFILPMDDIASAIVRLVVQEHGS